MIYTVYTVYTVDTAYTAYTVNIVSSLKRGVTSISDNIFASHFYLPNKIRIIENIKLRIPFSLKFYLLSSKLKVLYVPSLVSMCQLIDSALLQACWYVK